MSLMPSNIFEQLYTTELIKLRRVSRRMMCLNVIYATAALHRAHRVIQLDWHQHWTCHLLTVAFSK